MFSIFLLLIYASKTNSYGYDSGSDQGACGKPFRSSRMHQPPCDLENQTYCASAGKMYPWHAVRRFIRENQGLMKRMYGDERHIAVLKAELQTNDIPDENVTPEDDLFKNAARQTRYPKDLDFDNELFEDKEANTARYLQDRTDDIILNTKFVYEPGMHMKLSDLQAPRFRPTSTQKPVEVEQTEATSSRNKTIEIIYENITEIFYEADDNQTTTSTESVPEKMSTTEDVEVETTTEFIPESTTISDKKEPSGEVLFQDMETSKPQSSQINYKLRGVNACPVKEEVVAPFWANNTRGEVLALLNMYPFEQYVHWEKCTFENRQMYCREGCRCEQQYRLHRLLAYDPNNECRGIFSDWFRFPSCCVCKCYDMPAEFRVTSRSPRSKEEKPVPNWFKKKMSKQKNKDD